MTQVNQIWHGDSVEMCQKFKPGRVDCIITDPPFGVANQSNMAKSVEGKQQARTIANDESPEIAIKVFKDVMESLLPKTRSDCDMYVFTSYQVLSEWLVMTDEFMPNHNFKRKAVLVWQKEGPGLGDLNCPWGMASEFILFFQKGRREKTGTRRNNVLSVPQLRPDQLIHPHQKPPALLELLIKQSTLPGEFIVDPFAGSGSTVHAAARCGRSAVGIEYDEYNAKVAKRFVESASESLF